MINLSAKKLSTDQRTSLYRAIAAYERRGLSVLNLIENRALRAQKRKLSHAWVLLKVNDNIQNKNMSVADALREFIPAEEFAFLKLSERTNSLSIMLDGLVHTVEKRQKIEKTISTSLISTSAICLVGILVLCLLVFAVIPQFKTIIGDNEIAGFTATFFDFIYPLLKTITVSTGIIIGSYLAAFLVFCGWMKQGGFRRFIDNLPLFQEYKMYLSSVVLTSMANSMMANVSFLEYFTRIGDVSGRYLSSVADAVLSKIHSSQHTEAESMDVDFFSEPEMEQVYDFAQAESEFGKAISVIGMEAIDDAVVKIEKNTVKYRFIIIAILLSLILSTLLMCIYAIFKYSSTINY